MVQRITMLMILGAMLMLSACNAGEATEATVITDNTSVKKPLSDEEWLNMAILYNDKMYDMCIEAYSIDEFWEGRDYEKTCQKIKSKFDPVIESIQNGTRLMNGPYFLVASTMEEKKHALITYIDQEAGQYEISAYNNQKSAAAQAGYKRVAEYINKTVLLTLKGE